MVWAVVSPIDLRYRFTRLFSQFSDSFVLLLASLLVILFAPELAAQETAPKRAHPWTTSRIRGTPDPPLPYKATKVFEKVELDRPTNITWLPDAKKWVANHSGQQIVSFDNDPMNAVAEPLLDLSDVYQNPDHKVSVGFSTKFHHDLQNEPWCFITFRIKEQSDQGHHLARLKVIDATVPTFDPDSLKIMARWKNGGHMGASMQFGPDGMFYCSTGDGQPPYPPDADNVGQDKSDFRCAILRIDVDNSTDDELYRVPKDNPFVGQLNVREEIWAYGLRNPWKIAFHPETGELLAADVGWEMRESIFRIKRGRNFGWSIMEGSQPVKQDEQPVDPITPPLFEHDHTDSRSITGGHFWMSDRIPELQGAYIYGDWMTGKVWGLKFEEDTVVWQQELVDTPHRIICFMLDPDGEVLIVGYDGTILRLDPNQVDDNHRPFPTRLSETGLFTDVQTQEPAEGVVEYQISAPHWADGTQSRQWIGLPESTQLSHHKRYDWKLGDRRGRFMFPVDTVVAKTVSYQRDVNDSQSTARIETQILHKYDDDWRAYNYIWNEDQTDAELQSNEAIDRELTISDEDAPGGKRTLVWRHASRTECTLCHVWPIGTVHSFWPEQLNITRTLDGSEQNQLDFLAALGFFAKDPPRPEPLACLTDDTATLESRGRAYLQLNCSSCHRRQGGGTADFTFDITNDLAESNYLDAVPAQGTFGIHDARVIAPGDPYRSVLLYRALKSGRGHMPQFGSSVIDRQGVQLLHDWIASMEDSDDHGQVLQEIKSLFDTTDSTDSTDLAESTNSAQSMLDSVEHSMALAMACCDDTINEKLRESIIQLGAEKGDATIRDLFEDFLPEDQRVERLGPTIDAAALLALEGSVENGRTLFESAKDVNCRTCHRIGNIGAEIGPDLSGVGFQQKPVEILDSILRPSAKIDQKFRSRQIFTNDGKVLTGMVTRENESEVVLADSTGKEMRIAMEDIDDMSASQLSIMPEQLLSGMTPQNAADLLAFLAAQKKQPPSE